MTCDRLRDDPWESLEGLMPGGTRGQRGPRTGNRRFVDALLSMARFGKRWRDLPVEYGSCPGVKRRHDRWIAMGVLDDILAAVAREAELEWLMIDATIARARQHAARARKDEGRQMSTVWAGCAAA